MRTRQEGSTISLANACELSVCNFGERSETKVIPHSVPFIAFGTSSEADHSLTQQITLYT